MGLRNRILSGLAQSLIKMAVQYDLAVSLSLSLSLSLSPSLPPSLSPSLSPSLPPSVSRSLSPFLYHPYPSSLLTPYPVVSSGSYLCPQVVLTNQMTTRFEASGKGAQLTPALGMLIPPHKLYWYV